MYFINTFLANPTFLHKKCMIHILSCKTSLHFMVLTGKKNSIKFRKVEGASHVRVARIQCSSQSALYEYFMSQSIRNFSLPFSNVFWRKLIIGRIHYLHSWLDFQDYKQITDQIHYLATFVMDTFSRYGYICIWIHLCLDTFVSGYIYIWIHLYLGTFGTLDTFWFGLFSLESNKKSNWIPMRIVSNYWI